MPELNRKMYATLTQNAYRANINNTMQEALKLLIEAAEEIKTENKVWYNPNDAYKQLTESYGRIQRLKTEDDTVWKLDPEKWLNAIIDDLVFDDITGQWMPRSEKVDLETKRRDKVPT